MAIVLLIDDDEDFKGMIASFLGGQGHKVVTAASGREGLQKAGAVSPDLIFLDVMMPDMNGIEVLRELNSGDDTRDVPVFVITASVFDKKMSDYFKQESNCREFLAKNTDLGLLGDMVRTATAKK